MAARFLMMNDAAFGLQETIALENMQSRRGARWNLCRAGLAGIAPMELHQGGKARVFENTRLVGINRFCGEHFGFLRPAGQTTSPQFCLEYLSRILKSSGPIGSK